MILNAHSGDGASLPYDWSFQMTIYVMINIVNSSSPIDFLLFSYCVVLTAVASDNKDI
jgi:hypothetical protein